MAVAPHSESHSQSRVTLEETEPGPEEGRSVSFLQELHQRPWSWILPIIIFPTVLLDVLELSLR